MRHTPVQAVVKTSAGPNNGFIQGGDYGFRIVKLVHFPFNSEGALLTQAQDTDFATIGPGFYPVKVDILRELDDQNRGDLGANPQGGSSSVMVFDSEWQRVPSRFIRISADQPYNFLGQSKGNYAIIVADTLSEMDSRILRPDFGEPNQLPTTAEYLAPAAGNAVPIAGAPGVSASNPVFGLSKMIIYNLGPNAIYFLAQHFALPVPTAAAVVAAGVPIVQVAATAPDFVVLDNLGDTVAYYIASTVLQVAGAGTRVMKFFGSGVRS